MIFSALLTVVLFALIIYALLQKKQFPMIGNTLPLVCAVGIVVAWFPEATSEAARWVGIGRGVDLMLYVWMVASGLLFLVVHLKLVAQQRQVTELARFIAIQGAHTPSPAELPDAPAEVAPEPT